MDHYRNLEWQVLIRSQREVSVMLSTVKRWVRDTPLEPPARFALNSTRKLARPFNNGYFLFNNRSLRNQKKIIYAITPPPHLDNIGDHAQVIGIKKWFDEYFSEYEVLEVDKNQTNDYISALRHLIDDGDVIFLHSGGNMNDRSLWSEGARRKVIRNFRQTPIIQLPQTVYFSDTERGRQELKNSKQVYNSHQNLTIVARDPVSHDYVQDYFDVQNDVCPDFALMVDAEDYIQDGGQRSGVMLCLRRDEESDVTAEEKKWLLDAIQESGYDSTQFDTTLDEPIPKDQRETFLADTLRRFAEHDLVITDRFHGMIFSVITKTPCIAIDTVDHKISSSSEWFDMYGKKVRYVDEINAVPDLIEETADGELSEFDWETEYFSKLAESIKSNSMK